MKLPIYLDNHASTPVDPCVLDAMLPFFTQEFGNAGSHSHEFGHRAAAAVDNARSQVASLIGARPDDILFTSGATESDNLAIKGSAALRRHRGDHIVTAQTEHKAVLDSCKRLEHEGLKVTYLPVDETGMVHPDSVEAALTDRTILVSLMLANNEIGTIQPIAEVGRRCRERGILFHTDATQGVGRIPVDVEAMNVGLLSFTAHKLYGPKGVGALYVRRPDVSVGSMIDGGGQEQGMRSGTLNVPGIVGFGAACARCQELLASEGPRLSQLSARLQTGIQSCLEDVHLNGHPAKRLPGNVNLSFAYVDGESLLAGLPEIALSSGAACTSASREPSYVLKAMGMGNERAFSSLRFGIGRFNTEEEVDYTIERVVETVQRLRELSPLVELARGE